MDRVSKMGYRSHSYVDEIGCSFFLDVYFSPFQRLGVAGDFF